MPQVLMSLEVVTWHPYGGPIKSLVMRKVHTLNHIQAKFTLVTAWPEEVPCFDNSFLLDKIQGKMNQE